MLSQVLLCALAFVLFTVPAEAAPLKVPQKFPFSVVRKTLPNGIVVLMIPRRSLPIVSFQTWFRVGSKDEKKTRQHGLAHLFEHLMFTGTPNYPKNTYDLLIESSGGNNNAYTTRDYTQYHVNIRSDQLDLVLELESDRIKNFQIAEEVLAKEKKVVLAEQKETFEDSMESQIYQKAWDLIYGHTPYGHSIIGTPETIRGYTLKEVSNWHATYYHGHNIVLTVVGDFHPPTLLKKIRKKYGSIPSGKKFKIPQANTPTTPEFKMETVPWRTRNFSFFVAYPTVRADHKDTFALDILSNILHDSKASRLYKDFIIKKNIANFTQGSHSSTLENGMFYSFVNLHPGVRLETGSALYRQTIEDIKKKGVSKEELRRVRTAMLLEFDQSLNSVQYVGTMLSLNELLMGSFRRWITDLNLYYAVTSEDVVRVLNKYINPEKAALVVSHPHGFAPPHRVTGFNK